MKIVKPSVELQTLLDHYRIKGGVVEYVLMEPDTPPNSEADLHKEAALLFIEAMQRKSDEYFLKQTDSWFICIFGWIVGISSKREDYFEITHDAAKAISYAIELSTFLGAYYCFQHGLRYVPTSRDFDSGYWGAFSEPPFSIRATQEEISSLFNDINNHLFGGLDAKLDIREWSTEWSNYFDVGHEWWGSYLWTIHVRGTNRWMALGASDTA